MPDYVVRKGVNYYFRIRTPSDLTYQLGCQEFKIPLSTDDLSKAASTAKLLHVYALNLFSKARNNPMDKKLCSELLNAEVKRMLDGNENGLILQFLKKPEKKFTPEQLLAFYSSSIATLKNLLISGELLPIAGLVSLFKQHGIELEYDTPEYVKIYRDFIKICIEAFEVTIKRAHGDYNNDYDAPLLQPSFVENKMPNPPVTSPSTLSAVAQDVPQATIPPLNILVEDYCREKANEWNPNTAKEYRSILKLLVEHFGSDTSAKTITRPMMIDFRDNVLRQLPAHRNKKQGLMKLSLKELIECEGFEKIKLRSVEKYCVINNSFFIWCMDNKYITDTPTNKTVPKRTVAPYDEREKYTQEEISLILTEINKLVLENNNSLNIDRFWITLIGLLHGVRLNEACQLFIDNICAIQGIPCIKVVNNMETKQKTKNRQSIRTFPINPILLRLNFLGLVQYRRELRINNPETPKADQIFESMTYSVEHRFIKNFQYFYGKFNRNLIPDKKKTFHSFRHNFDSCLINKGVTEFHVQCLDGHKREGETLGRYAKPDISALLEALNKLDYGINIFDILKIPPLPDDMLNAQIAQLPVQER